MSTITNIQPNRQNRSTLTQYPSSQQAVDIKHKQLQSDQQLFSNLTVLKHALATPLTNILLNLEVIFADRHFNRMKPNCQHYLSSAWLSAKYIKRIMDNTTHLSQQFYVAEAIKEVLAIYPPKKSNCHLIPFIKIDDQCRLNGSRIYFQEIVICLLNNAFEAYQPNSSNRLVILTVEKIDEKMCLRVVDGGRGFESLAESNGLYLSDSNKDSGGTGLVFAQKALKQYFQGKMKIKTFHKRGSSVACFFPLSKK